MLRQTLRIVIWTCCCEAVSKAVPVLMALPTRCSSIQGSHLVSAHVFSKVCVTGSSSAMSYTAPAYWLARSLSVAAPFLEPSAPRAQPVHKACSCESDVTLS